MIPTVLRKRVLLLLTLVLLVSACKDSAPPTIAYESLTEAERHLPENALAGMEVAQGLQLSLFASEPMVVNPTNMAVDAKGRVWVCEGRNYRLFANPDNPYDDKGDRILILEDTDGDGKADTSKVFYQGEDINSALGIAVLGEKVIVSKSPNVFVFTDADGDDIPDNKEVLFTGLSGGDHDHGVHAFVFGPDGRLYFNYGNQGKQLMDRDSTLLQDKYGGALRADGNPYREGMAFRMDLDGKNVEVLGHNFRNPYELTVDSYGGIWQSDNDDDGNRGTRINYLMEYGNYGFKDLLTGKNWRERRPGWEEEIPKRHWHLNDPGTVPNVLQTGSGSPTGILFYEDTLLPERFQNQLIHCEPGHNVVRSYHLSPDGAGYTASIENLVKAQDNWFRPSDVAVAPGGSLFISDWYDGGVGGHKVEDLEQGRIYHVSTENPQESKKLDLETTAGAVEGILSGNMDTFYRSWQTLHTLGTSAEAHLLKLMDQGGTAKARALWLAGLMPGKGKTYIEMALKDADAHFRLLGLRMARYVDDTNLERYVEMVIQDPSLQVKREAAIALRHVGTERAAGLWAQLAMAHDQGNRWYLEALGIGADRYPNTYFKAWQKAVGSAWKSPAGKDIVWRIHAEATVPLLVELLEEGDVETTDLASYFRAFSFKDHPKKNEWVMSFLEKEHPQKAMVSALALGQLDSEFVNGTAKNKQLVKSILPSIEGSPEWLLALRDLKLTDQNGALMRVLHNINIDKELRTEALELLFKAGGRELIAADLAAPEGASKKMELIGLLGGLGDSSAVDMLMDILKKDMPFALQRKSIEALGNTWGGQHRLFDYLKEGQLQGDLKTTAVLTLMNSFNSNIRVNAPTYLDQQERAPLDVAALVERTGDVQHGKEVYAMYCSACHMTSDGGAEFGPSLTDIGNKLSKEFLYSNIMYPSAGISFGYEGYSIAMKDGTTYVGYILSRTEDVLTIKMMGGTQKELQITDIESQVPMEKSLMTEGLDKVMTEDELIHLVEYLTTLKVVQDPLALNQP